MPYVTNPAALPDPLCHDPCHADLRRRDYSPLRPKPPRLTPPQLMPRLTPSENPLVLISTPRRRLRYGQKNPNPEPSGTRSAPPMDDSQAKSDRKPVRQQPQDDGKVRRPAPVGEPPDEIEYWSGKKPDFGDFRVSLPRCGTQQSGNLNDPRGAVSGVIGFDQQNTTMLSQLAAAGKVRNKFAHCLDSTKQGGGIWAIGEVVEPKMKYTSPIVSNQSLYNIVVEKIEVGSDAIELPISGGGVLDETSGSSSDQIIAIFDSGTTLAYLPPKLHEPIVKKILATEPGLKFKKIDDGMHPCFEYSKNIDEKFPIVKFTFKNSASLWVYPHDYLFWNHAWNVEKEEAGNRKEDTGR
ncbi:aspartic proteinase 36-like [Rosa rugosa]|uniref:aspartic proteinase 36-like n=1 Tax=Rosa rugosa TaxID=74645 RepID=UPI002B4079D7|nr:aspartic proteinase 36-like [Rosa rugosa]